MTANTPTFDALRKRATRQGLQLSRLREGSRGYTQYGPYALIDRATRGAVAYGMTLADAAEALPEGR